MNSSSNISIRWLIMFPVKTTKKPCLIQQTRVCFCFGRNFPAIFLGSATGTSIGGKEGALMGSMMGWSRNGVCPPNGKFDWEHGEKPVNLLFSPRVPSSKHPASPAIGCQFTEVVMSLSPAFMIFEVSVWGLSFGPSHGNWRKPSPFGPSNPRNLSENGLQQ